MPQGHWITLKVHLCFISDVIFSVWCTVQD